ncbi:5-(carboxyamino)imidazole ribonucleotide synthase [Sphingomonas astaxanthinifaciens]|uniref:N5-carboxyaminoimidazole ribonucleotide synthase n=1 Tax=Sphingomonas astaxanthinifaciens DSM 22298 TaxID=1123267 RepID=A0ABQ5ZAA5_9SPHN|nr:5-(carboxyamino)imidazole ribonucleotide synthase [Sphingomonas astaxanthinifaciens]GLR47542.1 N5-carboxyaminoimidazole ribonucleotide synthase [Sphingomonas astaxanthinifaciens DSM 22298]
MIGPGGTIGIIGGGQLGRMVALAAAPLGIRCHVFDPHEAPCAADVAAAFTRASFDDVAALETFAAACDIVTYEFENLPVGPLATIAHKLRPGTESLRIAQDRAAEKAFVEAAGGRPAAWRTVDSLADLDAAVEALGLPLVLKTRRDGYDGKGQAWLRDAADAADVLASLGHKPLVAEQAISFEAEFSVVLARGLDGAVAFFDSTRNIHADGILRQSVLPAGDLIERQVPAARAQAAAIAERLGHVGVLTVEYFACADGPLVNEIAPRVHNSGHWTIEGAVTSQFAQHVRAVCGLPLGNPERRATRITMDNLIGDDVARWPALVADPAAHLHLYGKGAPRPGRKMGHVTRLA